MSKYLWHTIVYRTRDINILDLVEYEKNSATEILANELGWSEYGDKHFESIWTRLVLCLWSYRPSWFASFRRVSSNGWVMPPP